MTTVYQVGSLYVAKDMIFGWCVARDAVNYNPIANVSHEDIKVLLEIQYPAFVPEDFKKCLQRQLSKFELETAINSAKLELKTMREQVLNLGVGLVRSRDRVSLVYRIMENMVFEKEGIWTSDLGYVKILGTNDECFLVKNGEQLRDSFERPITFDEAIDTILRKWW